MKGPKVTVIGAGSYFFGRKSIYTMATSPIMAGGTLALVDTDEKVLKTMMKIARRVFAETKCGVKLEGSTKRREVMKDSDFIVLTFSDRNAHFRGVDTEIAARHGVRMCSSDTIGPGGIFRALREIPHALDMARDAARLAPDAWVINFVNPTAVLGMALRRFAPEVRSFAICDGLHEPYRPLCYLQWAGILPDDATDIPSDVRHKLDIAIGGVNHCTFLWRLRYDGKDMMPAIRRHVAAEAKRERSDPGEKAKARYNMNYAQKLMELYDAFPIAVSHTKEYVPFFQVYGAAAIKPEPVRLFDAGQRAAQMAEDWARSEQYASGKLSVRHFIQNERSDHATDIIMSMWSGENKSFYVCTDNRGGVSNLADDDFLELRCDLDVARGPRPQPIGPMPRGILGLTQQVLDSHEMTAEAAVTGDRKLLRRAMLTDPICNNIGDADAIIADLMEAERDALPAYWFKRGRR